MNTAINFVGLATLLVGGLALVYPLVKEIEYHFDHLFDSWPA